MVLPPLEQGNVQLSADQLSHLLEAIPVPARVVDAQGESQAQNKAALRAARNYQTSARSEHGAQHDYWKDLPSQLDDLGNGLKLQIHHVAAGENRSEMQLLARGIAHEIRNPLAAILTAVSLVQDDAGLAEETQMLLAVVRKEAQRMNRILNEFSSYVRPVKSQPTAFDLSQTTKNTLQNLREEGSLTENVEVHNTLPDSLNVYADEMLAARALHIVFTNALEAMNEMPGLDHHLELVGHPNKAGNSTVLIIEDTGGGLPPDSLERAFQPFFSTRPHNTGLGLPIARSIVENAGGHIWIENTGNQRNGAASGPQSPVQKPARGARVSIELPITAPQA